MKKILFYCETVLLPAVVQEVTIVPEEGGVKLLETYL